MKIVLIDNCSNEKVFDNVTNFHFTVDNLVVKLLINDGSDDSEHEFDIDVLGFIKFILVKDNSDKCKVMYGYYNLVSGIVMSTVNRYIHEFVHKLDFMVNRPIVLDLSFQISKFNGEKSLSISFDGHLSTSEHFSLSFVEEDHVGL
jgi:hypothetical protein